MTKYTDFIYKLDGSEIENVSNPRVSKYLKNMTSLRQTQYTYYLCHYIYDYKY